MSGLRQVKSYVLRIGRMSVAQKRSYDTLSPQFCLPFGEASPLEPEKIFGSKKPLVIEIGFGMGIATAMIADQNPEINYLALEVHRPGIGRLLWEIDKRDLKNLRIIEGDAVETIEKQILPGTVSGFHVFFPDPWPKKRHQKRRLIKRPFTDLLANRLQKNAYLYMVTDWADYGEWALAELAATPGLVNKYPGFAEPQSWRPRTKFEEKGLMKEHKITELYFTKDN
ncbi:tRNA (guanosine(46)-N7)-methyltransferase TrmB [Leadbettera azotonutricia]|uniref:tRNA (guanine-N(7)-)-methyltransferase n=1 Tax=Leadbettera azotonutricia (strain ATCC BAA-888 / DSM 13862 / ZAS-9) TaxID=545695 RepID=F5YBK7_LEAAZ|nr:tRNA (guanosine(46)-N7)-methyltransferase TrmB [Leadbettera azotonutricia]AEF81184.1 tRNA (guanine-N(7)-)-methyltransferase [Leadbettera azotonutricia ZAS-9]